MDKIIYNHPESYGTFYGLASCSKALCYFVDPKSWGHIMEKKKQKPQKKKENMH